MNGIRGGFIEELLEARATQLVLAVAAAAAAGTLIAVSSTHTSTAAAVGLVAVAALMRWPALTVVSLLIVCQEIDPSEGFGGPYGSSLLFLGHQVYFTTIARFSLLTLVLLLALARIVVTLHPPRPRLSALVLVLALGLYYAVLAWGDGSSVTSAINQDSRFAILFAACFGVGISAASSWDWEEHALPVLRWLMSAMAVLGLYLVITGQGESDSGVRLIFYDSALGAIAGAAALAAVFTPAPQRNWRTWWLACAALAVVVLSARRNVWAALAVAVLLCLMVTYHRTRLVLRLISTAAVVCIALAVFLPSVMTGIGHQLSAIWGATQGTAADASVKGHLNDISLGWNAVKASPISGVGPNGQLVGLVIQGTGPLYIHNQILESWLRFGLLAAVLVVAVQVVLLVQGLRAIRLPRIDFTVRWAALLLIMAPVSMLTAPFLTNTQRWPAILGFAAGLVAAAIGGARAGPRWRTGRPPEPHLWRSARQLPPPLVRHTR